ncbi:hypothetical protein CDEST_04733 [Colletotrichum destructivum]|uniref:Uncharacterized protein n=1 Tax=Colletotrichum destructivum TaxID=34406 RepID=A0AAX4I9P8_9PEZI|nr:hypothetical protein CDEST_04733 [Colletotrichum destructivum]
MGGIPAGQRSVAVGGGSEWHWNKHERDGSEASAVCRLCCPGQPEREHGEY